MPIGCVLGQSKPKRTLPANNPQPDEHSTELAVVEVIVLSEREFVGRKRRNLNQREISFDVAFG